MEGNTNDINETNNTNTTNNTSNTMEERNEGNGRKPGEGNFVRWLKNPAGDVALFIIAVVLLNLVASRAFLRWDLTKSKSYSLSPASKELVRTLEEPLDIKVFFSKNLPSPYSTVYQYVQGLLSSTTFLQDFRRSGQNFQMRESRKFWQKQKCL